MTASDLTGGVALEMHNISKRFGETRALDGVDLRVSTGTVHAVLGENGAGKSTLMKIAYGVLEADAGTVALFGEPCSASHGQPRTGIGMVHQHLSLVPTLSAAENFELGGSGRLRLQHARLRLQELSVASGLAVSLDALARDLSVVQQQRLEILKALGRNAKLLILDEPTSILAPAEAGELFAWIRAFVTRGGSVVLVTHKLREAMAVAQDITVLRQGRVVWSGAARATSESALAGTVFPESIALAGGTPVPVGDVCVSARDLEVAPLHRIPRSPGIRAATFEFRRGEIVGIAAVEGAGQRELLVALAGLAAPSSGVLELPDEIAFIPADRQREAIIPEFSIAENVALRGLGARRGTMPWREIRERASRLIRNFSMVAASPNAPARTLSGGNQQRLVVARELEEGVDLIVADNPTRGLDLQATAFVHQRLRDAASAGAAVVLHSSDLDEVLAIASRVFVVFGGRVSEMPPDRDIIGRAMLGAA